MYATKVRTFVALSTAGRRPYPIPSVPSVFSVAKSSSLNPGLPSMAPSSYMNAAMINTNTFVASFVVSLVVFDKARDNVCDKGSNVR